ncbi:MAG: Fic family protein, partial [Candidatus Thorarchaeota archaeon]
NYLSYSYREGKRVQKKERYLGVEIPPFEDLIQVWEEFSFEIVNERWISTIEKTAKNFRKVFDSMPLSIRVKNLRSFGIRFTHHSSKIEGSKLTLRDVQAVIENETLPKNRKINDVIETKAHMSIYEKMITTTKEISMDLIREWHEELFHMTNHNIAGIIRDYPVEIIGSKVDLPMYRIEIEMLLKNLFDWYNERKDVLHPVFLASIMHYRFVAIHPFGDGNGRMARLLTNYILHKNNYPMFDIDANTRFHYYKALEKTDDKIHELPFIQWFFKNYIKANKKYQ